MRNLKKVLSLALAMVMLIGMMVVGASATTFSDDADIKHQEAVDVVSGIGILQGIGDGSFNPEGTLSRAEAAVVIAKLDLGAAFGNLETTNASTFDDVSVHHWGKAYIDYCAARGLIAGDGNGKFMPDETVTGVEFGLMVSRVLGYEDANEDVSGVTWTVKAAALSRKAGLTKDVILTDTAISRDDMAQVAYNALQADMVEYDGHAITIGDVVIPAGKATTVYASGYGYDYFLDEKLQLCEEKFPNLRLNKEAADENGRPANVWTYGVNNVISSVAHEATFEIKNGYKGAKLASTVGKAPLNNYTWYYYIDGELQTSADDKNGATMRADARANGTATTYAGTGTTTYIYVDDTVGNASVTVCEVNVYGGQVTKVTDTNVTVGDLTFETTAFEEDDVVLYTKGRDTNNGKEVIVTMEAAEKVEGTLAKVTSDTSFVVGDTTYKYNCTVISGDKMDVDNVKSEVVFYVDHDGNMIYRDSVIANVDYAYVLAITVTKNAFKEDVCQARLLKTDGSVIEVRVDNTEKWSTDAQAMNAVGKQIVSYTESNGQYILTALEGSASETDVTLNANNLGISQSVSGMKLYSSTINVYGNDDTVFLVKNSDNTYSVYKGYKNVPSIKGRGTAGNIAWYCKPDTSRALVVYVDGAEIDTSDSDDIIFVVGNKSSKRIGESNGTQYYEFDAVVNDEVTTIKVAADTPLSKSLLANDVVRTYRSLTTNSKGLVTKADPHAYAPTGPVSKTSKISSSVIGFGTATFGYTDTTRIVKLDLAGDITVGGVNLVKNDDNDLAWVVQNPSGKLLSAFIMEKAKGAVISGSDTDPEITDDFSNAVINTATAKITVNYLYGTDPTAVAQRDLEDAGYEVNYIGSNSITATRNGIRRDFSFDRVVFYDVNVDGKDYYVKADGTDVDGTALQLDLNTNTYRKAAGQGTGYTWKTAGTTGTGTYKAYEAGSAKLAVVTGLVPSLSNHLIIKTGYVQVTVDGDTEIVPAGTVMTAEKPDGANGTGFQLTKGGTVSYVKYDDTYTADDNCGLAKEYVKLTVDGVVSPLAYSATPDGATANARPSSANGTGWEMTQGDTTSYVVYSGNYTADQDTEFKNGYIKALVQKSDGTTEIATFAVKYGTTDVSVPVKGTTTAGYTGTGYCISTSTYVAYDGKFKPNADTTFKAGFVKATAPDGTVTADAYSTSDTIAAPTTGSGAGCLLTVGEAKEYVAYSGNSATLHPTADYTIEAGYVGITWSVAGLTGVTVDSNANNTSYVKVDAGQDVKVTIAKADITANQTCTATISGATADGAITVTPAAGKATITFTVDASSYTTDTTITIATFTNT